MKKWILVLLALLPFQSALADGSQPTKASVEKLIKVMHARKTVDSVASRMNSMMKASMKRQLGEQKLNAKQQKIIDNMEDKMVGLIKSNLDWSKMQPDIIQIYQRSFSQKNVNAMIDFYKTPSGQQVIAKMPLVMQNTMQMVEQRMGKIMPQIRQLAMDTSKKLKAAK